MTIEDTPLRAYRSPAPSLPPGMNALYASVYAAVLAGHLQQSRSLVVTVRGDSIKAACVRSFV